MEAKEEKMEEKEEGMKLEGVKKMGIGGERGRRKVLEGVEEGDKWWRKSRIEGWRKKGVEEEVKNGGEESGEGGGRK